MIAVRQRFLTVCAACLTVSCLEGVFRCVRSVEAGVERRSVDELRALDREHQDWWEENRP